MKRNIRTKIKTVPLYQSEYSLETLEKKLADAKILIPEKENGFIKIAWIEESEEGESLFSLDIFSTRLETDEEEAKRIERDKRFREAEKKAAEEKEKRLYERLKAKYETGNDL